MLELDDIENGVLVTDFLMPDDFDFVYPVSYACGEITGKSGAFDHSQDGLLLYVISGHGEIRTSNETLPYFPRQIITSENASHIELHPAVKTRYLCLFVRNPGGLLGKTAACLPGDTGVVAELFRLYQNAQTGMPRDIFTASVKVYALLMELRSSLRKGRRYYSAPVRNAIEIIREEYACIAGIDELAERLEISKCHLVRLFSAETGKGPGQYLQDVRLEHARLFLSSSDYSISLISDMSGYSCSNYFCKVFRKKFGLSPGKYRELHKPVCSDLENLSRLREIEDSYFT